MHRDGLKCRRLYPLSNALPLPIPKTNSDNYQLSNQPSSNVVQFTYTDSLSIPMLKRLFFAVRLDKTRMFHPNPWSGAHNQGSHVYRQPIHAYTLSMHRTMNTCTPDKQTRTHSSTVVQSHARNNQVKEFLVRIKTNT